MSKTVMRTIIEEVESEAQKQFERWGVQNHSPETWIAIISEEVGEAAKAGLKRDEPQYRHELYQLAAAVVCALYELDIAEEQ